MKNYKVDGEKTEIRLLEQNLRECEARYRNFFDNASDPIYCYDSEGYFLDVNKAALALIGCSKEELIGTHISQWITPESLKITKDDMDKRIKGESGKEVFVLDVIDKNRKHHWVEIRRQVVKDGDKNLVYGIGRDITEKRKLETELRESEAKYRGIFENALDAMFVISIDGTVLNMNRTGLSIIGCKKDEVIGKNIYRWLTPESLRLAEERVKRKLAGEIMNDIETLEIICKKGERRILEIRTKWLENAEGAIEIHGTAKDITENTILRTKLRNSNKQKKLLCYLIKGTRGGKTRALILKRLAGGSYNANQLAIAMNMDYKTIRHHLGVLVKNGIISKGSDGYSDVYYISKNIEPRINELESGY